MSKHTKGKWVVEKSTGYLIKSGDQCIAGIHNHNVPVKGKVGGFTIAYDDSESKANANLIASAPEMLEMLKSEREWMFKYVNSKDCPEHLRVKLPEWLKDDFRARFNLLEILIAKAEGK